MNPSAEAHNGGPVRRKVTITNAQGLHLRPMQAFVELASRFQSNVRVQRDDREPVEGRSILSLMQLGAERGTELVVEAEGPDAEAAVEALVDLLANLESRVDVGTNEM